MAYQVVVVPGDDQDTWSTMLHSELERLEAEGWALRAMTTKTVPVGVTSGMGGATRYEVHFVLVVQKAGEA